jgi:X-X-X-Leu-X-X-Gly heptad repeat protein
MNKTLLLILCDFLLLTLLALSKWEKAEPPRPKQPPVPELAANAVTKDQDLVAAMQQALADEQSARDDLAQKLSATDATLAAREQSLTQAQAEAARLAAERNATAASLAQAQKGAAELTQRVATVAREADLTREQLAAIQRELAENLAEARRIKENLAKSEEALEKERKENKNLTAAYFVAEAEKKNLIEKTRTLETQAKELETQVRAEQAERIKVQETATTLAAGVGQLAEKSGELTKEIRDYRPINANVLFNDFLANRVTAKFAASRRGFLGRTESTKEASTVLVTDGSRVYALLHISDTPFALGETGIEWDSLAVELAKGGQGRNAAGGVDFLAHDPRLVALPLEPAQVAALGAKVYALAADPVRFPEAVLIDGGGRGYGEVGFKLDPADPGYVRVDNRFFKRLFGDFAPKRGDLVFAKSGELLGVMVNGDYCALLKNFAPQKSIAPAADLKPQATGALFDALIARLRALPPKLQ